MKKRTFRFNGLQKFLFVFMLGLASLMLIPSCGKKSDSNDQSGLQSFLSKTADTLQIATNDLSGNSERDSVATALSVLGFDYLKPIVLGQEKVTVKKSDYPIQDSSTKYAILSLTTLGLDPGSSIKASFNYTVDSVDKDKMTLDVEASDFSSNSENKPLTTYYFGDWGAFGKDGPQVGQKFKAYVTYYASTIKIGIALPIIVIDEIEL
ncbi:MAG: hypothetical protein LBM77_00240 [Spirochaetaceae bacterium]|nr:hypothetical protein [Spirochaetaceae bacterium]